MNESTQQAPTAEPPKLWAIIELLGRTQIAGAVSEQSFGGETFTRVDIPEVRTTRRAVVDNVWQDLPVTIPAHTKLVGGKAVYSIAFVDEAAALAAAHAFRHHPVSSYTLRDALRLLSPTERQQLLLEGNYSAIDG